MPLGGHEALEESHEDENAEPPLSQNKMSMLHRCCKYQRSGHCMLRVLLLDM